jgi:hypothetical protein
MDAKVCRALPRNSVLTVAEEPAAVMVFVGMPNVNTNYNWQGALDYVAALNAMNGGAGFAGRCDWRLRNIMELPSIVRSSMRGRWSSRTPTATMSPLWR